MALCMPMEPAPCVRGANAHHSRRFLHKLSAWGGKRRKCLAAISQQPARNLTVPEWRDRCGLQFDFAPRCVVRREDIAQPTSTALAKYFAHSPIERAQFAFLADAFAVRRIADDDAG